MATRVWNGGAGDWADPTRWTAQGSGAPGAPMAGDAAVVAAGSVDVDGPEGLDGSIYNGVALQLGDAANDPALLQLSSAYLERYFSIQAEGSATVESDGASAIACPVTSGGAGTVLTLAGDPSAPNGLLLTRDGSVTVKAGATLDLEGVVTDEASVNIEAAAGSTVRNDAAVTVVGGPLVDVAGALTGTGSFTLDDGTTLYAEGSVSAGQTIRFGDVDGKLEIADPNAFAGAIAGFSSGNLIDVTSVAAASAAYDAASQTLTLYDGSGGALAALHDVQAAPGALQVADDGTGGTTVSYAGSLPRRKYQIADGDKAMGSDVARATESEPTTGAPVTGAGVKVGIISGSFDVVKPGSADADAAAGYLPENPDGTSAVTVLKEGDAGNDDEGRAMAELVHQVAPGAQLYFATRGNDQADFAASVKALQAAGCQVIADDITYTHGPFYQVDASVATTVAQAVASGVSFFTSAGNFGQAFLEQPFTPRAATLPDGTGAEAEVFDDGTPTETITVPANDISHLDLQWTAPYEGVNNAGAPDALGLEVFDASGKLVGTGTVETVAGVRTTDVYDYLPVDADSADYRVAVTLNGGQVSPSAFKLILSAGGTGTGPGGYFHDPAAGQGSGDERAQQLVAGANVVGESDFANSAAFGLAPSYNVDDSDQGPGTLLYDGQGNPLPAPQSLGKVDFDGPTGIDTVVPGFAPFYGTSAATPNAAAVAALMLQANPNLTPAQVTALLKGTAADQGLPAMEQGAGLVQAPGAVAAAIAAGQSSADAVAFEPGAAPDGAGGLVLTGRASAAAGIRGVEISAVVGGARVDLGAAAVNPDGTFTFDDAAGPGAQSAILATVADAAGGYAQAASPDELAEALGPSGLGARVTAYGADGPTSTTLYRANGSRAVTVSAPGQSFASSFFDTFRDGGQPDSTFVFDPGHGLDVVRGFRLGGPGHDTLSFAGADFGNSVAAVLADARGSAGGVVIVDPVSGDAVRLAGVAKEQLRQNPGDVAFHP